MISGYSIAQLKETRAFAVCYPHGKIKVHWAPWKPVFTGEEWRRWFGERLHAKINRHEPSRGRKDTPEWFHEIARAARQLNQPRLVIRWLPPDLRQRFAARLQHAQDE